MRYPFIRLTAQAAAIAIIIASCSGREGSNPVPKPEAFPRIEMPDSTFTTVKAGEVDLTVNSGAVAEVTGKENGDTWVTLAYPQVADGGVYLTLSRADGKPDAEAVMANRRERMELNLAGASGIATTLTSAGGWECEMLTSRTALSTPVQILATDGRTVLSGTLYLPLSPGTNPDSVAPVIDAIDRDMLTLLKNLH